MEISYPIPSIHLNSLWCDIRLRRRFSLCNGDDDGNEEYNDVVDDDIMMTMSKAYDDVNDDDEVG